MKSIAQDRTGRARGLRRAKVAIPLGIAALVGLPVLLAGGAGSVGAATPLADLPVFPDNLVVFPNRDFITVEGFADHVGQSGKIEVTRPGVGVVGSAIGVVSGGDVAFEINHPGGYCWGAGTGVNVTPDILPGDVVTLSFGSTKVATTLTLDVAVTDEVLTDSTLVLTGHIGAGVLPANMEQRIIEPALVDTAIGRRDVRAVDGPLTPAPKGGYQSSLEVVGDVFTATYIFDNASDAQIAFDAGGERAMAWELADADGNRQGLTIAERGELGGPGMGGCPNGPLQSGPPGPSSVAAVNVAGGVKVNWTPATAVPGTPAIKGYRVTAIAHDPINGEQVEIGKRITNAAATNTTITGLTSGVAYDFSVASFSSVGETFPPIAATFAATDTTPPTVTASPAGGSYRVAQQVTLTANEFGSDIYYTLDGHDPISGDQLGTPEPLHYTGPITIDASKTLKFAAFDPAGNHSTIGEANYLITNDPVAGQTAFTSSTVGVGSVTLNWAPADPGLPTATIAGYKIDAFLTPGGDPVKTVITTGTGTTAVISGLASETPHFFTVSAMNSVNTSYGAPSAVLGPLTPQGDVFADAGPDKTGLTRNTTVTLSAAGSSSATGTTYSWRQLVTGTTTPLTAGPDFVIITPVPGQPQNATFTLPFFQFGMSNGPLTFELKVTAANGTFRTDTVLVSSRSDTMTVTSAKWKTGDFRVVGTSTTDGAIITLRSPTGTIYGSGAVVGGAFDIRIRGNTVPTTRPATAVVDSNLGGTFGPFAVAQG